MKFLLNFIIIFLIAGVAFGDDPGDRDSLIIETVHAELGDSTVDVRVYATSDDSVGFYNIPITWFSPDSAIIPSHVTYSGIIIYWDDYYDTLLYDLQLWRMLGWCDVAGPENPPLLTNNLRVHCWTLHFTIDSSATPQYVPIDTTHDPINGSLLFGLEGGIHSLIPVFTPGAIFYGITSDVSDMTIPLPLQLNLYQNYPNPFNASTNIEYRLPVPGYVSIEIYDLLGRKIETLYNEHQQPGRHQVIWDASDYPSGIYFYRLEAGKFIETRRMLLLK